jgi:hypothetical protein
LRQKVCMLLFIGICISQGGHPKCRNLRAKEQVNSVTGMLVKNRPPTSLQLHHFKLRDLLHKDIWRSSMECMYVHFTREPFLKRADENILAKRQKLTSFVCSAKNIFLYFCRCTHKGPIRSILIKAMT